MKGGREISLIVSLVAGLTTWYTLNLIGPELAGVARLLLWSVGLSLAIGLPLGLLYLTLRGLISLISSSLLALERIKQARQKTTELALQQRRATAEVRKLEREAELTIITSPLDHQVHISDLNPNSVWQARHLEARLYSGPALAERAPQPWEVGLWLAARSRRTEAAPAGPSESPLLAGPTLPERIDLADLLPQMRGSLKNIILGVRLDEAGQLRVVSAPMYRLCHIGAAGATDSGKSNFGRAIAYQVFTAAEPVQVVVSDLKATTFKVFAGSERLLYPIIQTPAEFIAVMAELNDEMNRRKALFKPYPTVETLMDYNKSGVEPLPFIVIFIDEVTNLFMTRETQAITLEMLREARAFGLYFMAMGQSWSHREMATSIRQQFRTGMHFGTNDPASSRMIVNSSDAIKITTPGRALASLPFGMSAGAVEIQTPYLETATVLEALGGAELAAAGPARPIPALETDEPEPSGNNGFQPTAKQAQVLELWDKGILDKKSISRQVYGRVGGSQYQLIEATLSKFGRI
jgi:hypothetical protein